MNNLGLLYSHRKTLVGVDAHHRWKFMYYAVTCLFSITPQAPWHGVGLFFISSVKSSLWFCTAMVFLPFFFGLRWRLRIWEIRKKSREQKKYGTELAQHKTPLSCHSDSTHFSHLCYFSFLHLQSSTINKFKDTLSLLLVELFLVSAYSSDTWCNTLARSVQ